MGGGFGGASARDRERLLPRAGSATSGGARGRVLGSSGGDAGTRSRGISAGSTREDSRDLEAGFAGVEEDGSGPVRKGKRDKALGPTSGSLLMPVEVLEETRPPSRMLMQVIKARVFVSARNRHAAMQQLMADCKQAHKYLCETSGAGVRDVRGGAMDDVIILNFASTWHVVYRKTHARGITT